MASLRWRGLARAASRGQNGGVATLRLHKGLGQHHLADGKLCRPLVEDLARGMRAGDASVPAAPGPSRRPLAGRTVLEIGPGGGVLTAELLRAGARVLAVELDRDWALALPARLGTAGRAELAVADALDLAWERLPAATLVVGNLPYNVATAIIGDVLRRGLVVPAMGFLVQLEVAERLVAKPGTAAYGGLSVLVAMHAEATILGRVAPGSFRPPPRVWSAFVGLRRRAPPLPPAALPGLERTIRVAFAQRRKTLRNNLVAALGREAAARVLADLGDRLGWRPDVRAEALGLDQLVELHRAVCNLAPSALD